MTDEKFNFRHFDFDNYALILEISSYNFYCNWTIYYQWVCRILFTLFVLTERILFKPFPKQQYFIEKVFDPQYSFLVYGGAAGGGKTFVSLGVIIMLCRFYPKSRYAVIRKSLSEIKLNTLPSFWKICPTNFVQIWNKSEFTCTFKNGSQIIFKGENISEDPELQWMDGLEVNGFLLEQAEELQHKTFDKSILRAGRHVINPMPPIKILLTLNPSLSWPRETIYQPFVNGTLKAPYFYQPAFISDNTELPEQYVKGLTFLDSITYRRFVEGDWTAFAVNNPFAYAFDKEKHEGEPALDPKQPVQLSFDFNVDPITCIAGQGMNIISEFRLQNSDIYSLCDRILAQFPRCIYIVTGDATGHNRSALAQGNINYYTVISQKLNLVRNQLKTANVNPSVGDSRVLLNSILQNGNLKINKTNCPYLITDLQSVEVNEKGEIDKSKDKYKSHLLDCLRYYLGTFYPNFLTKGV